jgi:uncharacterized protein (TIGR02569 family)
MTIAPGEPEPAVCAAFGAPGTPLRLEGGRGSSWRVGDLVLKPADLREDELRWQHETLVGLPHDEFRVAPPRRAEDGSLVVDGWCASPWLEGRHEQGRWADIVAVGDRFHAALASVERSAFLERRTDVWAIGDRVAWGELDARDIPVVKHLPALLAAVRPVAASFQLIHGDLTGNVLFADGLAPAIIDFSPYWRPPSFASAIVVCDALVWEGADERLLHAFENRPDFAQLLLRALIYRTVADRLARLDEPLREDAADPFLPVVELALRAAGDAFVQ